MKNEKRELNSACDFIDGMKVEAMFNMDGKQEVVLCELKQVGREWFLCQDKYDGSSCGDKRGYKYSWTIGSNWRQCTDSSVSRIWATNKTGKPTITETANAVWKELEDTIDNVKSYAMGLETVDKVKDFTKSLNKLCK